MEPCTSDFYGLATETKQPNSVATSSWNSTKGVGGFRQDLDDKDEYSEIDHDRAQIIHFYNQFLVYKAIKLDYYKGQCPSPAHIKITLKAQTFT